MFLLLHAEKQNAHREQEGELFGQQEENRSHLNGFVLVGDPGDYTCNCYHNLFLKTCVKYPLCAIYREQATDEPEFLFSGPSLLTGEPHSERSDTTEDRSLFSVVCVIGDASTVKCLLETPCRGTM